jgi:integrase
MKGSIFKRCGCAPTYGAKGQRLACKLKHGSWSYIADAGRDPKTNKRRQVKRGGFATKAEAEAALAEVVDQAAKGMVTHDDRQTVAAYLESWLAAKVANGLRPTTARSYRQHIDDYLTPELGHLRLRDLRGTHVEAMLAAVQRPKAKGKTPKAATARRVHATLRSSLATAQKRRLVPFNAAKDVELPSVPRPKVRPWEPADLGAFLDAVAADRLGAYFELDAASGLRRGEALGLGWPDVELERGRLIVRQQIAQLPGMQDCQQCGRQHRGLIFAPVKTESGEERIVDLDSTTVGLLIEHRLRQDAERAEWGEAYNDHSLVFAQEDGNPLPPNRVSSHFASLVKKSGLRRVRLHDLRHGRASLLLASGTDIAIVSKLLGHSSIAITSDTYSHLLEGVGKQAAERAAALVPRAAKQSDLACDQSVTNVAFEGSK